MPTKGGPDISFGVMIRRSLSVALQVDDVPLAISASVRMEQGATIMPRVRNDSLEIDAPMSLTECTKSASAGFQKFCGLTPSLM
jgi:hypothetical protein